MFQHQLTNRIDDSKISQAKKKFSEHRQKVHVGVKQRPDKPEGGPLIFLVWRKPAGVFLGFAQRLGNKSHKAVGKVFLFFRIQRISPRQRLINKIFVLQEWQALPVHLRFLSGIQLFPFTDSLFPLIRKIAEHEQPGPRIFATLGIMCSRGIHGQGIVFKSFPDPGMKVRQGDPKMFGRITHFVMGNKFAIGVKTGIFYAFGHHRTGKLHAPPKEKFNFRFPAGSLRQFHGKKAFKKADHYSQLRHPLTYILKDGTQQLLIPAF